MCVRVYVCVYLCACVLKFCVCVYLGQAQAYSFLEIGLLSASVCVFSYALCSAARSRFQNTHFKQIQIYILSKYKYIFRRNTNTSASICVFSYALCSGARSRFLISAHHCINKLSAVQYRKLSVHV